MVMSNADLRPNVYKQYVESKMTDRSTLVWELLKGERWPKLFIE